jgi:hypothetical protein
LAFQEVILVALGLSRSDLPRDVVAPGLRWPSSFSWLLLAFRKKLDLVALGPLQEVIKPRDAVAPGLRWLVFILWFLLACKKLSFVFTFLCSMIIDSLCALYISGQCLTLRQAKAFNSSSFSAC